MLVMVDMCCSGSHFSLRSSFHSFFASFSHTSIILPIPLTFFITCPASLQQQDINNSLHISSSHTLCTYHILQFPSVSTIISSLVLIVTLSLFETTQHIHIIITVSASIISKVLLLKISRRFHDFIKWFKASFIKDNATTTW